MAVVYFNQRLAAVHSNAGQNMSISLFPQTIRKKWQNEAKWGKKLLFGCSHPETSF